MRVKIYTLADDYAGYNSPFWAQHGVSFLVEVEGKKILFDTASYAEPILFNMKLLNLNPRDIDMIVLSHNHFDHTGGLLGILREINRKVPIFAHPEIFKVSFALEPEFMYAGTPRLKEEAEKLGGIWILTRDPITLMPGVFTLGEIKEEEKVEFEKGSTGLFKIEDGRVIEDKVEDEIGLAINTRKGLVVLAGCAHPGIVSMVKKAIKLSGNDKVYAVLGGFHLINAEDSRIEKTVEAFKELEVKKVYAGHCTGLKAESRFAQELGDRFEKLHSGKIIEIS
ncbi:MBL fold metallo-hydrolase [Pyrococcus horikoshii]|uniref:Metallo-beta-lactamase domain-containing protein n=2 Tax=Pyrococcus horikoshii TaxID=53953 RepID=O58604_PYRHO|nr:MBL fold metallo-hydrolase [Pyrococcus horikoshii]BAA29968.1 280aa long hypothetical protein [Pyrococcus horikoshii OT3]HII61270.1 MBL fold metallo-hydrolase [Pyrococcus horikoshii]